MDPTIYFEDGKLMSSWINPLTHQWEITEVKFNPNVDRECARSATSTPDDGRTYIKTNNRCRASKAILN